MAAISGPGFSAQRSPNRTRSRELRCWLPVRRRRRTPQQLQRPPTALAYASTDGPPRAVAVRCPPPGPLWIAPRATADRLSTIRTGRQKPLAGERPGPQAWPIFDAPVTGGTEKGGPKPAGLSVLCERWAIWKRPAPSEGLVQAAASPTSGPGLGLRGSRPRRSNQVLSGRQLRRRGRGDGPGPAAWGCDGGGYLSGALASGAAGSWALRTGWRHAGGSFFPLGSSFGALHRKGPGHFALGRGQPPTGLELRSAERVAAIKTRP